MNPFRPSRNAVRRAARRSNRISRRCTVGSRGFEPLEDRRLMAVDLGQSVFSPSVMGNNIELMSTGNAVGYGYAINFDGQALAAVGGDGQARTSGDTHPLSFTSLTEMDISSVSKTVTATAILHLLQSQPGGLDAALSTPLADYLPSDWSVGTNVGDVTLRHLLTHTSGFSESDNPPGIDFNSPGNATYVNLKALVAAPLPDADDDFDPVYHGPRWNGSYNNANFALLARVVLPKLVNPAIDLTAANYVDRDLTSGTIYKHYVQDEIFEPLGIVGANLDVTAEYPTMGHFLGAEDDLGEAPVDRTRTGGAGGWKMDARELAVFLDGIKRDNSLLSAATRQMRDDQELGWFQSANTFGESFSHNGANGGDQGLFRSQIVAMPGEVEVAYLMNSGWASLPGENIFNMLETAYTSAWTDLTVNGTSGADDFVLRLNNSGFKPSIEVELNGEVQFTHWISTLDSLTLNGLGGNDTFTIEGSSPAFDLVVNGGSGDDTVDVLPGARNIELVNGMTFNGGAGDDSIVVNDQSNPYSHAALSRVYTVTSGSVARFTGHPAYPGNPAFFLPTVVNYSGVENLDLSTGGQSDGVTLVSKTSGETSIRTGNGDDTIVVAQTAGNLESVDGLEVDGQAGLDTIRLYDHNKTSADPQATAQYDVDAQSVSRYMASLGGIFNGQPPTTVGVDFSHVENLELSTSAIDDVIRIHATPTGDTTVHGGAGDDVLIGGPTGQNLEQVDDLVFQGDAGIDSIVLNDQNNPYSHPALSRVYSVSATGVSRSAAMPGNPFAIPVPINVGYSSVEELTLTTGGQTDVVNVESVPSGEAVLHTGAGNDVVNASPTAANFETVGGLTVDGGAGSDSLNIHDENNPYELGASGSEFTITPSSVFRYGEHPLFDDFVVPVELDFSAVESVSLATGDQQDVFNVEGVGSSTQLALDGNAGGDRFNVTSPAFSSISIQGDAPIFAPGDQLSVNEDGFYAVATIPGLYTAGSGGVTIGGTTISYAGIETTELQSQIYGGPGDFDLNGLVNGEDLTHPTLGWNVRFGDDLDGRDLLIWQQNLGANRLPRGGRAIASASAAASTSDAFATAPVATLDGDGDVDGRDFLLWQRNLGTTAAVSGPSLATLDAAFSRMTNRCRPTPIASPQQRGGRIAIDHEMFEGKKKKSEGGLSDETFAELGSEISATI